MPTPRLSTAQSLALWTLASLALAAPTRAAEPRLVSSGTVTLPLSGLTFEVPEETDIGYLVSGFYSVVSASDYGARDIITQSLYLSDGWDDYDEPQETVWVQHGLLREGGCAEFLAKERIDTPSDATFSAWGLSWTARVGTLDAGAGSRPVVIACTRRDAQAESLVLHIRLDTLPTSAARDMVLGRAQVSDLAQAIAGAYRTERVAVDAPLLRSEVAPFGGAAPLPRTLAVPFHKVELALPKDGFAWSLAANAPMARTASDFITSMFPSATDLGIEFRQIGPGPCEGALGRTTGTFVAAATVAGWSGERVKQGQNFHEVWLCKSLADRAVIARLTAKAELGELARFQPILEAIATALATTPAPPARPASPKSWTPTRNPKDFVHIAMGLEGVYSSRETGNLDPNRFPATRLAGPGIDMQYLWMFDGFLGRMNLAATFDLGGLFDDQKTSAARWGAQHLEFAFEIGFCFGDDLRVGVMAGWTGMSGPLTLNSSLSVSAAIAMPPEDEDELGWILRVTPLNLLAANERSLFSPLAIDLDFAVSGIGLGAEFQYIGAPEVGDEDIPAAGWAVLFRFGLGGFLNRF